MGVGSTYRGLRGRAITAAWGTRTSTSPMSTLLGPGLPPWTWPLRSKRGRQNVAPSPPGLRELDPEAPTWACLPPLPHGGAAALAGKPKPAPPSLPGTVRAPLVPSASWGGGGDDDIPHRWHRTAVACAARPGTEEAWGLNSEGPASAEGEHLRNLIFLTQLIHLINP